MSYNKWRVCPKCDCNYAPWGYCAPCMSEYKKSRKGLPCTTCGQVSNYDGSQCRDCKRDSQYKAKYNITLQDYERMLSEQDGVCAICHKPETNANSTHTGIKLLSVDHDHKTGAIRGLLCDNCNVGLGRVEEYIPSLLLYLAKGHN